MKLLLLVQTESDVAHLEGAARAILNSAIKGVWVVYSPAITINASEAAAKLDAEIAQLKTAERQSADRGDYAAAAGYKTQREGKELERGKALHDAWKTVSAEDRKAKVSDLFGPTFSLFKSAGLNARITGHSDHYDREQWVAMLNSLSGVWFKEFVPGSFVVAWPESVETSLKGVIAPLSVTKESRPTPEITPTQKAEYEQKVKSRLPQVPKAPLSRADELGSMKYFTLIGVAKKAGVDPTGKKGPQIIEEILAAEAKPAEPALAEY